MDITIDTLRSLGACYKSIKAFDKKFGKSCSSVDIFEALASRKSYEKESWVIWAIEHISGFLESIGNHRYKNWTSCIDGVHYIKKGFVLASGKSVVYATGTTDIVAFGHAGVYANDNVTVTAKQNSRINVCSILGRPAIEASGNAQVTSRGNCKIGCYENSVVRATNGRAIILSHGQSTVYAYDASLVVACSNSTVYAGNNSIVDCYDRSIIHASDYAIVRWFGRLEEMPTVSMKNNSTLILMNYLDGADAKFTLSGDARIVNRFA